MDNQPDRPKGVVLAPPHSERGHSVPDAPQELFAFFLLAQKEGRTRQGRGRKGTNFCQDKNEGGRPFRPGERKRFWARGQAIKETTTQQPNDYLALSRQHQSC